MRQALAALALVALAGCAGGSTASPSAPVEAPASASVASPSTSTTEASPVASTSPAPSVPACAAAAAELTPEALAAQRGMGGIPSSGPGESTSATITDVEPGFVLLLGNTDAGVDGVADVTDGVRGLVDGVPVVVAVDQEGGEVQRLRGTGFSDMPSALTQSQMPAGELRAAATTWGEELSNAGVLFDLAPVADVVPEAKRRTNAPIGRLKRNYGFGDDVTRSVVEVVEGLDAAGVATSLKHFPGLGKVTANTDFAVAHDDSVAPNDPDWAVFSAAIDAGASSVMISSAIYEQLDATQPAMFSRTVITDVLRGDLGYAGLVISDDVGAAIAVADVDPGDRALRFLGAGGDVVITADPTLLADMVDVVLRAAGTDKTLAAHLLEAGTRVLALKQSLGLPVCG